MQQIVVLSAKWGNLNVLQSKFLLIQVQTTPVMPQVAAMCPVCIGNSSNKTFDDNAMTMATPFSI